MDLRHDERDVAETRAVRLGWWVLERRVVLEDLERRASRSTPGQAKVDTPQGGVRDLGRSRQVGPDRYRSGGTGVQPNTRS